MKFWHPRYWLIWLGISLLWLIIKLPIAGQQRIAQGLGKVLFHALGKRRRICCINLKLAFPELDQEAINNLNQKHFNNLAMALFEAAMGWWGKADRLRNLYTFEGEEHVTKALAQDNGVILLGAHFTNIELSGRLLSDHLNNTLLHFVYRPHQNDLLESIIANNRAERYGNVIQKSDIRGMVRTLKQGHPLWYAQDQSYRGKTSVEVDFFNVATDTNSATSWLCKVSKATVVPLFTFRDTKTARYILRALPPLDNFPSGDDALDTQRINDIIASQIREFPDQYLWTHKRFKTATSDYYSNRHAKDVNCQ